MQHAQRLTLQQMREVVASSGSSKQRLEKTPLPLHRRLRRLIQQPPQIAVVLRRAAAVVVSGSLILTRTDSHPRRQFSRRGEGRRLYPHLGDHLLPGTSAKRTTASCCSARAAR